MTAASHSPGRLIPTWLLTDAPEQTPVTLSAEVRHRHDQTLLVEACDWAVPLPRLLAPSRRHRLRNGPGRPVPSLPPADLDRPYIGGVV